MNRLLQRFCRSHLAGFLAACLLSGVLQAAPAFAAVAIYGSGGAPTIVRGDARRIRLVQQEIRVVLPSRRVCVRSIFRNEGAATRVVLGLPEHGETGESGRFPASGYLRNLQAMVDGKRVALRLSVPKNGLYSGNRYDDSYDVFWAHEVAFAKGQTRVLQHEFSSGQATMRINDPSGGAARLWQFAMSQSAAWKGAIGNLKIVFDVEGLKDFQEVEVNVPRGEKIIRSGDKLIWQTKNFEPKDDDNLNVSWWPGIRFFEVDGEEPSSRALVVNQNAVQGDYDSVYPLKRNGKIWVPLRLLLDWLPAAPDRQKNQITRAAIETYFSLQKGARSLYVIVGSRELEASEDGKTIGRFQMSEPAYVEKNVVMVELAPAIRALGGRVESKNGIVRIFWK